MVRAFHKSRLFESRGIDTEIGAVYFSGDGTNDFNEK